MLKILVCLLTLVVVSPVHAQDAAEDLHNEAWELIDEGDSAAAAVLLQRMVEEYPQYYAGYMDYWESLRKVTDAEIMRARVRSDLLRFEQVPREERTEDLYSALVIGAEIIRDKEKADAVTAEWIERFPRGLPAQQIRLRASREADDPRVARSLYLAYMHEFPENKSWVQLAARDCFGVIAEHPDRFTLEEMVEVAEAFDRTSVEYIPVYGNPYIRFHALVTIAHAFLDRDPEQSLRFADRGLEFVAETAPQTDEFDETIGRNFEALKVMAWAKLERWTEARTLAAGVLAERGDRELKLARRIPLKEPQFRATYAELLVKGDELEEAHRQFRYAVALDPSWQERYDKFCTDHPLDGQQAEAMDQAVKKFMHARSEESKRRVLAKAMNRPAPSFTVLDLEGNSVSLEDFRGKVVVLDCWATWCGPCIRELKEIKKAWEKYRDDPDIEFLAVSTDFDQTKVAPFIEKNDYRFRVLYSNGQLVMDYVDGKGGGAIPQLYIIDGEGNIRFHKIGFNPMHFLKNLDWMIEAAMEAKQDSSSKTPAQ